MTLSEWLQDKLNKSVGKFSIRYSEYYTNIFLNDFSNFNDFNNFKKYFDKINSRTSVDSGTKPRKRKNCHHQRNIVDTGSYQLTIQTLGDYYRNDMMEVDKIKITDKSYTAYILQMLAVMIAIILYLPFLPLILLEYIYTLSCTLYLGSPVETETRKEHAKILALFYVVLVTCYLFSYLW